MLKMAIIGIVITGAILIAMLVWQLGWYRYFKLNLAEFFIVCLLAVAGSAVGWIFYRSQMMMLIIAVVATGGLHYYRRHRRNLARNHLVDQFLSFNRMLISELHAGKSVEMAFRDILVQYQREGGVYNEVMCTHLAKWCQQLDLGWTVNQIICDFANESGDDSLKQYAMMFDISSQNGASLLDVIDMTDRIIKDRRIMESELAVLIAEKKLEQRVLSVAPIVLLWLMQMTSYQFIAPLYTTLMGRILMTISLAVFVGCYLWSNKMTETIQ